MKNLIKRTHFALYILLPVFVFCDAQAQVRDTLYQITCDGDTTGRYFVFERGQMPSEYATQNIIQLMFEYETECYNDSTEATYDFYKWGNDTIMQTPSIDPGFTMGYIGRKTIYEHREPTFKYFVRWVRKKYCR